jgi:hypothetical protein
MCFKGTASRIGGVGFEQIAKDTLALHAAAYHVRRRGNGGPRASNKIACANLRLNSAASVSFYSAHPLTNCPSSTAPPHPPAPPSPGH